MVATLPYALMYMSVVDNAAAVTTPALTTLSIRLVHWQCHWCYFLTHNDACTLRVRIPCDKKQVDPSADTKETIRKRLHLTKWVYSSYIETT